MALWRVAHFSSRPSLWATLVGALERRDPVTGLLVPRATRSGDSGDALHEDDDSSSHSMGRVLVEPRSTYSGPARRDALPHRPQSPSTEPVVGTCRVALMAMV